MTLGDLKGGKDKMYCYFIIIRHTIYIRGVRTVGVQRECHDTSSAVGLLGMHESVQVVPTRGEAIHVRCGCLHLQANHIKIPMELLYNYSTIHFSTSVVVRKR